MDNNIMVSIVCVTYNHENFIEQAIKSFVGQQTNFNFEILIHDDASTDKTTEIIKKYQKQYPNLIKPIYQIENQYSKGEKIDFFLFEKAEGKYIAICEGDDYWTDSLKLQKQVNYMEANPECTMCVHAAHRFSEAKKKIISVVRANRGNKNFSVEEVIEGGGGLFATNSILMLKDKLFPVPSFYFKTHVIDYPIVIHYSLIGTVYYIDEIMSAYRVDVNGSWTQRELTHIDRKVKHYKEIAEMLDEVNFYTNFQYKNAITRTKKRHQFYLLLEQKKFREALDGGHKELYLKLGFLKKSFLQRVLRVM